MCQSTFRNKEDVVRRSLSSLRSHTVETSAHLRLRLRHTREALYCFGDTPVTSDAAAHSTVERALTAASAAPRSGLALWAPVILAGVGVWIIPRPAGVNPNAWQLLAIFTATIVGLVCRPLPPGAVAILGIAVAVGTGTLSLAQALSGFGNSVVWLVIAAFFIATGFLKTGLGARIAYLFLSAFGGRTLGLAYALVATDLVLARAIPSNTARAGGVILPILRSLSARLEGGSPGRGATRAFLTVAAYQGTVITSAMFLTAMVANPLAAALAAGLGVPISWTIWALAAALPGACSLLIVPLVIYALCPPDLRTTPDARAMARMELRRLGSMSRPEWILLAVVVGLLCLWIFGARIGLDSTTAAFMGLGALLTTRVLAWEELSGDRDAWNTAVWFATLVMMATFLNELGLVGWFSDAVGARLRGLDWLPAFLALSLIYFYSHYFFASNTAHVSSMYAPFLAVALAVGTPPMLGALALAYISNLMACLTHYGTAPAPILFAAGDVSLATWWRVGAVLSLVHLVIWLVVGGWWWRVLGLW